MDLLEWIAFVVLAALLALAVPAAGGHWTGEEPLWEGGDAPPTWIWGDALWRGWSRSCLAFFAGLALCVVGTPLFFVLDAGRPRTVVGFVAVGGLVGGMLLVATISLLNRPKTLVPRRLRGEPGALVELLRRRP